MYLCIYILFIFNMSLFNMQNHTFWHWEIHTFTTLTPNLLLEINNEFHSREYLSPNFECQEIKGMVISLY